MRTWTKRDPVKNYFPLPNEIYQLGLSHGAIAVYGYLLRIEDRRTYQCHPSYATIGKAVGMSNNTVRKYVQELEERGLIVTERTSIITQDGRKQNGSLLYTILPIQFSIDQFYQRQLDAVDRAKERQRVARRIRGLVPLCRIPPSTASTPSSIRRWRTPSTRISSPRIPPWAQRCQRQAMRRNVS